MLFRTHFKTDFEARSSEKLVGKAGGDTLRGPRKRKMRSKVPRGSSTLFAENVVPQALQPIAAERSFEMGSSLLDAGEWVSCAEEGGAGIFRSVLSGDVT